MSFFIETPRLMLVPTPLSVIRRRLACERFTEVVTTPRGAFMVRFVPEWPGDALGFFPHYALWRSENPHAPEWGGVLIETGNRTAIGQIGTKGMPDENGQIEIGYGINPSFQRLGYASEMVAALTEWLIAQPDVTLVTAQCLDDNAGSRRVLEKCGFTVNGARFDPDEGGTLLQWERR